MPVVFDNMEIPGSEFGVLRRVVVYLVASLSDTSAGGVITSEDVSVFDQQSAYTNAAGYVQFTLRPNAEIEPLDTYYIWEAHLADGRVWRRSVVVPSGAGPYAIADIATEIPPVPSASEVETNADRDAIANKRDGMFVYVHRTDRIYRYRAASDTWTPVGDYARYFAQDFDCVDDGDEAYGFGPATDNTTTMQDGIDYCSTNGGRLFFPMVLTGQYNFTNVEAKIGVRLEGAAGIFYNQFGYDGRVGLYSTSTGNDPAILCQERAVTLQNLDINGYNCAVKNLSIDHVRMIDTHLHCRADTGHVDNAAYVAEDSFWLDWLGGSARREGASSVLPNVILRGTDNPNVNTVNVLTIKRVVMARGNIEYQNHITVGSGGTGGRWIFEDVIMESLGDAPFLHITGNSFFKELIHIHMIRVERADSGTSSIGLIKNDCDLVFVTNFMVMGCQMNTLGYEFQAAGVISGGLYIGNADPTTLVDPASTGSIRNIVCIGYQFGGLYVYNGGTTSYYHAGTFNVKTNNSATIDVSLGDIVEVNDTSATDVTTATGGVSGQRMTIMNGQSHENTTIKHNGAGGAANCFFLDGGSDFAMGFHDTIELILSPRTGRWHELSRSANG